METTTIARDIKLMYVDASSFADGLQKADQKLHGSLPFSESRNYYGLSRPENGIIKYKAAPEEIKKGVAEEKNLKTIILKKGKYITLTVPDYMKNITGIGNTFEKLLAHPQMDPEGYCVEWYFNDTDVKCMIRLAETE